MNLSRRPTPPGPRRQMAGQGSEDETARIRSGREQAAKTWDYYSASRNIPSLFQALMIGLVHERPEDAISYLLTCVDYVAEKDMDVHAICWDTFINRGRDVMSRFQIPALSAATCKTPDGINTQADVRVRSTPEREDAPTSVQTGPTREHHGGLAHDPFTSALTGSDGQHRVMTDAEIAKLGSDAARTLRGDWSQLPSLPSNIVRIFLSSTFSDFKAERNILPKKSFPELQAYCQERGLDFQVVDMRWGVTDEVIHEHQVSALCLNEIQRCQELSCGPNFVVLLGNRYGFQPFQAQIEQSQFEAFVDIAEELQLDQRHLLHEWFLLDTNTIPAKYILQPIVQKLPYYNSRESDRATERAEHQQVWNDTQCHLRVLLRKCVLIARERHLVSDDVVHQHFMSVTEEEIACGLLGREDAERRVIGFIRDLSGLRENEGQPGLHRYIDHLDGKVDVQAQSQLKDLVENKLPSSLPEANICRYTVPWLGEALETSQKEEYLSYLDRFAGDFTKQVKRLIDASQRDSDLSGLEYHRLIYEEVVHHARYAIHKVEAFYGMEAEIEKIRHYLQGNGHDNQPLIIAGASGYGKTTFIAHVAIETASWLGDDAAVVARFLGKSPTSSTLVGALESIVAQICMLFSLPIPREDQMQTMCNVREIFWMLLQKVGDSGQRKLVIILDSVDQLHQSFGVHTMIWLPRTLPPNVYIIVSMLSDRFDCLKHVQHRIPDPEQYIHLQPLSSRRALHILNKFLRHHKRQVTEVQQEYILNACQLCQQPLYLRLLMEEAKTWNSYTLVSDLVAYTTVHEGIVSMFRSLECKFGEVFVQHALGYITCGKGGISIIEMEDVLSCDDHVLNYVYEYHDPPLDGMIRIPSLMWSRLQDAVRQYLVERRVDGKTVYAWYDRQFRDAADSLYLTNTEQYVHLHSTLADIFTQEDGVKRTITLHKRKGKILRDADRCVTIQPLNPKNVRKLRSMVHHLVEANRVTELKQLCFLNYKWLMTKLMANGAHALLHTLEEVIESSELCASDRELGVMLDLVRLSMSALWHDPALLAYQIVDRLADLHRKSELLHKLYQDASDWIDRASIPLLIPTHLINFQKPGSPLRLTSIAGSSGQLTSDESLVICNHVQQYTPDGAFNVFDLKTKEILVSVPNYNVNYYCLMSSDRQFIYANKDHLTIHEVSSGDVVKTIRYEQHDYDKITIRCLAVNIDGTLATLGTRLGQPLSKQKTTSKAGGKIYLVNLTSSQLIERLDFPGRRCIDYVSFIAKDTKVLATCRTEICLLDSASFTILTVHKLDEQKLFNFSLQLHGEKDMLFGASGSYTKMRTIVYDHLQDKMHYSDAMNIETEAFTRPFGLAVTPNGDYVIVGAYTKEETPCSSVGVWDRDKNTYQKILLQARGPVKPSALVLDSSCRYACVGWTNADVTIIDLKEGAQTCAFRVHGQGIDSIKFLRETGMLLTFSVDNTINMWNFNAVLNGARSVHSAVSNGDRSVHTAVLNGDTSVQTRITSKDRPFKNGQMNDTAGPQCQNNAQVNGQRHDESSSSLLSDASDALSLSNPNEPIAFAMSDNLAFTAPAKAAHCPGVWDLSNGSSRHDMVKLLQTQYKALFEEHVPDPSSASLNYSKMMVIESGEYLVYQRHGGLQTAVCVLKVNNPINVHMYRAYTDIYAQRMMLTRHPGKEPDTQVKYFLVEDTTVRVFTLPDLAEEKRITIPPVSEHIRNPFSNAGRKKLSAMKVAMTQDNKYLIIFNPAVLLNGGTQKPLDVLDLEQGTFVRRYLLPKHVSGRILACSFVYLVLRDDQCYLYSPSDIEERANELAGCYCCLLETGRLISEDNSLGIELDNKTLSANLWQLSPLKKLHSFTGHTFDLTFADISADNKYVVTASNDKTIRVWSIGSEAQLCCFHLDYGVDRVKFSIGGSAGDYIGVRCFSEMQHKRLVLLRFRKPSGSTLPAGIRQQMSMSDIGL